MAFIHGEQNTSLQSKVPQLLTDSEITGPKIYRVLTYRNCIIFKLDKCQSNSYTSLSELDTLPFSPVFIEGTII